MNTVIRSPNWIGDGIMCLPAIRAYKEHFPEERLAVVAKHYLSDIYLNIAEIDEIIPIPDRWTAASYFACLKNLRKKHFARGILFTNSFASALFFFLAGIGFRSGYERDGRGWLLTDKLPFEKNREHHQYYYLKLVEHLAGKKISRGYSAGLVIKPIENEWAIAWLAEQGIGAGNPLLAVAPAAAYGGAKTWPAERFRQLIVSWQKIHPASAILLLGGRDDQNKIAAMTEGLPGRVFNLAGRLSLRQAIAILAHCRLFIGNDSGLMHAAAALAIPLLAIFGPTDPVKSVPLGRSYRLLHRGAECAPCLFRECPTDHRCMLAIGVDEALAAALDLWQQKAQQVK